MNFSDKNIGWFQALFNIIVLWGIAHIAIGYCAKILGVNIILFSCISFASSALLLLLMSGYGKLAYETLKSLDTWGYGVILLLTYISVFLLFSKVSATEGSLLLMFGMNMSLLASWFFFSRKPSRGQVLGNLVVFSGLLLACYDTVSEQRTAVYFLVFILGIIATIRVFLAETHKPHTQATQMSDPKAKTRVIAFVMFIVSLIFTIFTVSIAALKYFNPSDVNIYLSGFPTLSDFLNPATIFAGLLYGAILMAPLRFLEFASTSRIKGENYLTVTALAPASTLFWEWSTHSLTNLSLETISNYDLLACVLITLGAFWAAISQIKKSRSLNNFSEYLSYNPQNLEQVNDTREVLANTLENFNHNIDKSAIALGIEKHIITAILSDKDKVLSFKGDVLKKVARQYRRNVAMSDALTGLPNRSAFMTALKGAAYEAEIYSVLFIDLNKFKPVNDTYGHDAGDFILQGVAERLSELYPKRSLVTRLGGDEFAILLLDQTKEQATEEIAKIKESIAKPFDFKGTEITIGGSVGIATYPEDGSDPESLLKLADESMYREKDAR